MTEWGWVKQGLEGVRKRHASLCASKGLAYARPILSASRRRMNGGLRERTDDRWSTKDGVHHKKLALCVVSGAGVPACLSRVSVFLSEAACLSKGAR